MLLLHAIQVHVELIVLVLHVEDRIFEEFSRHFFKILVGMSASDVEVSIDAATFDVDRKCWNASQFDIGIGDAIVDKEMTFGI